MSALTAFIDRYADIYEHSRWVAEEIAPAAARLESLDEIAELMTACVDEAPRERRLALIRAHPDLADRAGMASDLTAASRLEQASAGLDACSAEEYARFQSLNGRYREKFGFPFVMAVRGSCRSEILDAFERRLANDFDTEFDTAIEEIHKIARMRLQAMEQ